MSAGRGGDRYSITPPAELIPRQQATTGAQPPLALRQSMLSCLEVKKEVITDRKPGTCQSGSPQMNKNIPAVTPYCCINLCVFRHTFLTGPLCSKRWDRLLLETQALAEHCSGLCFRLKVCFFSIQPLPSRQIADLGRVPLCVCVTWCVGTLFIFLSFALFPIVWSIHAGKTPCVHPVGLSEGMKKNGKRILKSIITWTLYHLSFCRGKTAMTSKGFPNISFWG